ncbi:hypothetical protein BDN72DRAFT_849854 [Pluteus cervinus]|uniref:Uncharacterized protein n=1 Tax=Pluteus cervinus TaxID=181527 RepID=A0ACD3A6F6_9AGAR|nr:hypothetical protein BDN72DRAFT_849854 [Pluteus cervinus]
MNWARRNEGVGWWSDKEGGGVREPKGEADVEERGGVEIVVVATVVIIVTTSIVSMMERTTSTFQLRLVVGVDIGFPPISGRWGKTRRRRRVS